MLMMLKGALVSNVGSQGQAHGMYTCPGLALIKKIVDNFYGALQLAARGA